MSGKIADPSLTPARPNPWYTSWTFQTAHRLARSLPRPLIRDFAALIGHLACDLCDQQRDIMRDNLRGVTNLRGPELDSVCRATFVHFIQMLADTLRFVGGDQEEAWNLVGEWTGLHHLEASRQRGKGTILVTGHVGAWELGGILLALRDIPITVVTLAEPHAALGEWRERYREKFHIRTITLGEDKFAFVEIVRTLRENGVIALLADRPHGGHTIPVTLAGRQTLFSPAAALLHQHTGATVLPAFVFALPSGQYASHLYPPIAMREHSDARQFQHENTQLLADFFAALIRRHADQWYNYVPLWI